MEELPIYYLTRGHFLKAKLDSQSGKMAARIRASIPNSNAPAWTSSSINKTSESFISNRIVLHLPHNLLDKSRFRKNYQ